MRPFLLPLCEELGERLASGEPLAAFPRAPARGSGLVDDQAFGIQNDFINTRRRGGGNRAPAHILSHFGWRAI